MQSLDIAESACPEKIYLFGINMHDNQYIFTLIEVASLIAKEVRLKSVENPEILLKKIQEIEIKLLASNPGILLWVKNLSKRILKYILKPSYTHLNSKKLDISSNKIFQGEIFRKVKENLDLLNHRVGFHTDPNSVTGRSRSSEGLIFEKGNLRYKIHVQKIGFIEALTISFQSSSKLVLFFYKCFHSFQFSLDTFMNTRIDGVKVGPIAASVLLNRNAKCAGHFKPNLALWKIVKQCMAQLSNIQHFKVAPESFVYAHEYTYFDAIYMYGLHTRGAKVFEQFTYSHRFRLWDRNEELGHMFSVSRSKIYPENLLEVTENYLHKRLETGELQDRSYYDFSSNDNQQSTDLYNIQGHKIDLPVSSLTATVFLHSFNDGQYVYGYDGFSDIFSWAISAIDWLVQSQAISVVLVKPHPHVDYENSLIESKALELLQATFSAQRKVIFLKKDSSILRLAKQNKVIGITHHGSIIEELVFLRIPVICSTQGPWGRNYGFGLTYSNPDELELLLKKIDSEAFPIISDKSYKELLAYVYDYRIIGHQWEDKLFLKRIIREFSWVPNFKKMTFTDREAFLERILLKGMQFEEILDYLLRDHIS